ncbi:MAG: hypothetical protein ACLRRT_01535 [Ruthenibacterium lactatiformans]
MGCIGGAARPPYDAEQARRLWKTLLLNQFHDILPGSSIARVYNEANQALEALQRDAQTLCTDARRALLRPVKQDDAVTVFNGELCARGTRCSTPGFRARRADCRG